MKLNKLTEEKETKENVTVIKPPLREASYDGVKIFLAGSIDMGKAVDWQTQVTKHLQDKCDVPVTIFNPRRDDWDSTWKQSIDNPQFNEQVTWELDHLDDADIIIVYFDPTGKAPITLLELGLHVQDNIIVCCPDGFWRKGNVDIVCDRNGIEVLTDIDELLETLDSAIREI